MTPTEVAANPAAINELLDRLEAAEKDIALKERVIDSLGLGLNAAAHERDALRALVVMRFDLDYPPQFTQGHDLHELTEPVTAEHCRWFVAEIERLRTDCDALRAKIETAENDAAHQKAFAASAVRVAEGWERKCRELRAKIEAMENQEPYAFAVNFPESSRVELVHDLDEAYEDMIYEAYEVRKLYLAPGAQPAPSLASGDVSLISAGTTHPAQSVKGAIIDDLQSQFDTEGITEHDSGDALIRLSDAIAAVEDNFAQPAPSFADAYQGAMEDVAIWKKRALEAEDLNRKFVAEINGPAYMGEPAQPAPSVPECPYPCGWRNLLKHAIEDGAYLARSINEDEPVTENERAVTMRTVMRLRDVLMAINKAAPEESK